MHTVARAALIVLLATAGVLGSGIPATAQNDVPWTVGTAANEFGSDRANYGYTVDPGGRLEDGLVMVNHGTAPLDLAVYAADAFTTATGQVDLRTQDAKPTGVGAWVHPARDHVTVQPGTSADLPFTVAVPGTTLPGDHLGGIVASLTQGGVERRVGIRIRLRVGGQLQPGLSVEDLQVHYSGTLAPFGTGEATLTYTIRNTGNAIVAARQSASVSGPFGTWPVPADPISDSPQLLPGETRQTSVPVHAVVPALRLTGAVTLVPLLPDTAGSIAPLPGAETTTHAWAVPWPLLALLLALLLAVVLGLIAIRVRRHRRTGADQPAQPAAMDHQPSP